MKYYFIPKIEINVMFTDEEFEHLDEVIKANSEYKYQAFDENGWWFKIAKRRSMLKGYTDSPIEITFRQLDTLTKCLEPHISYLKTIKSIRISNKIGSILRDCNAHAEKVNPLFEDDLKEI